MNARIAVLLTAVAWLGTTGCESPSPTDSTTTVPMVHGTKNIVVANADGSGGTPLTSGGWPAWSPDSRRIAFHRDGYVYLVDAAGGNEVRLTAGSYPSWSPDGQRIVLTTEQGIAVMNVDGSAATTLVRHRFRTDTYAPWDMGVGKPSWSPDGKQIAFEHLGDGDMEPTQIFVMNADGSDLRRLNASDRFRYAESDPSWSPDGTKLTYWSYGYGIARINLTTGETAMLYEQFPIVAYGSRPTWSADGSAVTFTARSPAGPMLWVVSSSGGGARPLTPGYDAVASPDRTRLAFVRPN